MEDISIEELGLTIRPLNALRRKGVISLSQLMKFNEDDLRKIHNMGEKSINEVLMLQKKYYNVEIDSGIFMPNSKESDLEKNDIVNKYNNFSLKAFVFQAIPELRDESFDYLLYKNTYGEYERDINLSSLLFSVRVINALNKAGIFSIDEVARMDYEKVSKIRNFGQNCRDEICDYLKDNIKMVIKSEESTEKNIGLQKCEEIYKIFCRYFEGDRFDYSFLKDSIIENIYEQKIVNLYSFDADEDIGNNKQIVKSILVKENIIEEFAKYLKRIINSSDVPINKKNLSNNIPRVFIELNIFDLSLQRLLAEGEIKLENIGYVANRIKLEVWIDSLSEKDKIVMSGRVNKKSLQECADIIGVTRERVRQLEAKILGKRPQLFEEYYSYWFKKYEFDEESFTMIFDESFQTFSFLRLAYNPGKKQLDELCDDEYMTPHLYNKIKEYEHRNCIFVDGEYVRIGKNEIIRYLVKKYCSHESKNVTDFMDLYNEFLTKNLSDDYDALKEENSRALEGRIERFDSIIWSDHHRFRYYPVDQIDVKGLIDQFGLNQFNNVEISALKIFNDHLSLMEEYDILDEYELHNLMKRTEEKWNSKELSVTIKRRPFLMFGDADRDKQAEDLLFQVAPVSFDEFGEYYEMEYGVKAATALANMTKSISKYYHNGMYTIDQPILDENEYDYMRNNLTKEFYFLEDIKNIYAERFGEDGIYKVNPRTLKELHFKVYVDYVISDNYSHSYEYFDKLFLSRDVFSFYDYDKRLTYLQSANQALDYLRKVYDVLEYEDMKFISFKKLQSVHDDLTKDMFSEYVNKVTSFNSDEFFTIYFLQKKGLTDDFYDIGGFGEWFSAAIIKNSRKFKFVKTGGTIIFTTYDYQITTLDFIRYIMKRVKSMNIFDFCTYLKEEYNVDLQRDKISALVKGTDLYYDPIMEKIYFNKNEYYNDIS